MRIEQITHGMSKKPLFIDVDRVWAWYFSDHAKCTVLISTEGGAMPVLESVEVIEKLKKGETNNG